MHIGGRGLLVYWSAGLLVCWFAGLLACWSTRSPYLKRFAQSVFKALRAVRIESAARSPYLKRFAQSVFKALRAVRLESGYSLLWVPAK